MCPLKGVLVVEITPIRIAIGATGTAPSVSVTVVCPSTE